MAQAAWQALQCEAVRWRRRNQLAEASRCLIQAIELTRQSPDLAQETGTLLNYLADTYLQAGQLAEAETTIRQAIQARFSLPESKHRLAADDFLILADVLSQQGRHREAVEAGEQGLSLHRQDYGADDPFFLQIEQIVKQLRQNLAQVEQ
jgi:tetratricopeptide (TPR) repeat protein